MLSKKFLQLLLHGDVSIEYIDMIVFDEVHSSYPDHAYNHIMTHYYYNHVWQTSDKEVKKMITISPN